MSVITADNAWAYMPNVAHPGLMERQSSLMASMTVRPKTEIISGTVRFWNAPECIYRLIDGLAARHDVKITYTRMITEGFFFKTHSAKLEARGTTTNVKAFAAAVESIRSV